MATNFTFVPQSKINSDGRRRMRSRTACDACRNKKRRCPHYDSSRELASRRLSESPSIARPVSNVNTSIVPSIGENGDERNSPADVDPTSMDLTQDTVNDGSMALSQPQQSPQQHQPSSPPPPAVPATLPPPSQQPQPYPQQQDMTPSQAIQSRQLPSENPSEPRPPTAHLPSHIPSVSPQTYGASPSTPRFVGDLNPEARLLDGNDSPDEEQHVAVTKVGVWVRDRRTRTKCVSAAKGCSPGTLGNTHTSSHEHGRLSTHLPAAFSDTVPVETIAALSELYFVKIHPLLPILNEGNYRQSFVSGTLPAPLAHVVCLLAAKDAFAEPHLKLLQLENMPVSTRQFCSRLHTSIVTSLATRVGLQRLATIRTMALLSLHHEGCDGAEQASGYIAQAIHGAQSIALHLRPPNDDGFEMRRVFWCLYILDRFNAAMHSRPCIMFDHDIATEPITPQQSGFLAFDILFEITKILNKVIALYRPTNPESVTGLSDEFPSFSHILDAGNGWDLAPSVISTLEIFYFTTAILGHRLKTINTLPTSTQARMRQQLSTMQIIRYMREPEQLRTLHPFPIIVYAASLAVSVSYQQLRYSRLSRDQEQAKQDFNAACQVLQTLRQKWESADVMARLSHMISVELNKVPSLGLLRVNNQDSNNMGWTSEEGHLRQQVQHQPTSQQGQSQVNGVPSTPDSSQQATDTSSLHTGAVMGAGTNMEGCASTLPYLWDHQTSQIFDGMDDMAWMYLDAENPVSFDLLPPVRDSYLD